MATKRPRKRHLWREFCTDTYRYARDAWEEKREEETLGYLYDWRGRPTDELRDFLAQHPAITFKETLIGLKGTWANPHES